MNVLRGTRPIFQGAWLLPLALVGCLAGGHGAPVEKSVHEGPPSGAGKLRELLEVHGVLAHTGMWGCQVWETGYRTAVEPGVYCYNPNVSSVGAAGRSAQALRVAGLKPALTMADVTTGSLGGFSPSDVAHVVKAPDGNTARSRLMGFVSFIGDHNKHREQWLNDVLDDTVDQSLEVPWVFARAQPQHGTGGWHVEVWALRSFRNVALNPWPERDPSMMQINGEYYPVQYGFVGGPNIVSGAHVQGVSVRLTPSVAGGAPKVPTTHPRAAPRGRLPGVALLAVLLGVEGGATFSAQSVVRLKVRPTASEGRPAGRWHIVEEEILKGFDSNWDASEQIRKIGARWGNDVTGGLEVLLRGSTEIGGAPDTTEQGDTGGPTPPEPIPTEGDDDRDCTLTGGFYVDCGYMERVALGPNIWPSVLNVLGKAFPLAQATDLQCPVLVRPGASATAYSYPMGYLSGPDSGFAYLSFGKDDPELGAYGAGSIRASAAAIARLQTADIQAGGCHGFSVLPWIR